MTTTLLRLSLLLLAILPTVASAQSNIKQAFEAIINCPDAKISESNALSRDPVSGIKDGQCDICNFTLPFKKMNLIKDVITAFIKDSNRAYGLYRFDANVSEGSKLAIGDGSLEGVRLGGNGEEYIYALFLAPKSEDEKGVYRYAYGMDFRKVGDQLQGKLVITYAITLAYRQQLAKEENDAKLKSMTMKNSPTNPLQKSWFETVMSYLQNMPHSTTPEQISYATKACKVIQNIAQYPDVTDAEKNTLREVLKATVANPHYNDPILNAMLQQCINNIK